MNNNQSQTTLEHIQAQMAAMQVTIAQQQTEIAMLRAQHTEIVEDTITNRREASKRLAPVAVGTAGAGTALLSSNGEAGQAAGGSTPFIGWYAFPGSNVTPTNLPQIAGLAGSTEREFGDVANNVTAGVYGFSPDSSGVYGRSNTSSGVRGESNTRNGVNGKSVSASGVFATSTSGNGVSGQSISSTGVFGVSQSGNGVTGSSTDGVGVTAESINFNALTAAAKSGTGVLAISDTGKAVYGRSGNYGGVFHGGKAPLRLEPSPSQIGAPTAGSHEAGELFVDKNGTLFYCAISGTPGQWQALSQPAIIQK